MYLTETNKEVRKNRNLDSRIERHPSLKDRYVDT